MLRYSMIHLAALCIAVLAASQALAQGTATSPSTTHTALFPNVAYAGGINDTINGPGPYPIDLDLTGGPWRKSINSDPVSGFGGTGGFQLIETVLNVGTEAWDGWEEQIFSAGLAVGWTPAVSITVNGSPITFSQSITGSTLQLNNFSQPVLPGDVLEIQKNLITSSNFIGPNQPLFEVLEYPLAVPEPASLSLLGVGVLFLRRRSRN